MNINNNDNLNANRFFSWLFSFFHPIHLNVLRVTFVTYLIVSEIAIKISVGHEFVKKRNPFGCFLPLSFSCSSFRHSRFYVALVRAPPTLLRLSASLPYLEALMLHKRSFISVETVCKLSLCRAPASCSQPLTSTSTRVRFITIKCIEVNTTTFNCPSLV